MIFPRQQPVYGFAARDGEPDCSRRGPSGGLVTLRSELTTLQPHPSIVGDNESPMGAYE